MNISPIEGNVILQVTEKEQTVNGLIVPTNTGDLTIGEAKANTTFCEEGTRVLFLKSDAKTFIHEGQTFYLLDGTKLKALLK